MGCTGDSQSHLGAALWSIGVIPGELAIATTTRNPEVREETWIPVCAGMPVISRRFLLGTVNMDEI